MKKRIISLLAIATILLIFMVMPAYADMVHKESYDSFTELDDPTAVSSWVIYDNNLAYGGAVFDVSEDGALKIERKADTPTGPVYDLRITTNGDNAVLIFDFKQAIDAGVSACYINTGNSLRFDTTFRNPTAGEWYTHMYRTRDDAATGKKVVDFYIKGPFSTPEEKAAATWSYSSTLTKSSDRNVGAGIQINMNAASNAGQILWFNNIEVHQGLYMSDRKFQTSYNDGGAPVETEVTTVDEIVRAATAPVTALETKIDFFNCDFLEAGDFATPINVHPVLIALDENGKLLDCAIASKGINPIGIDNKVTVGFTDISEYANQIDKIQLLIWDSIESMQPIFNAIELN